MTIQILPLFFVVLLLTHVYIYLWSKKNKKNSYHLKYILKYIASLIIMLSIFYLIKAEIISEEYFGVGYLFSTVTLYYFFIYSITVLNGNKVEIKWFYIAPLALPLLTVILFYFNIHVIGIESSNLYGIEFKEPRYFADGTFSSMIIIIIYSLFLVRFYRKNYDNFCERQHISKFAIWVFAFMILKFLSLSLTVILYTLDLNSLVQYFIRFTVVISTMVYFLNPSILKFFITYGPIQEFTFDSAKLSVLKEIEKQIFKKEIYLDKDLSLNQFALTINVNPTLLSQIVKNETGLGFKEYINGFRVKYSMKLIEEKYLLKHSVTALCQDSGFNSPQTFFRFFKKINKVTPTEYWKATNVVKDQT